MPNRGDRSKPYWIRIRDKIDTGQAVKVLNAVTHGESVNGKEVTPLQAQVALKLVDKMLPSMQAVAVDISSRQELSKGDIESLLLSRGVQPQLLWSMLTARDAGEKVNAVSDLSKGTHPPDGAS